MVDVGAKPETAREAVASASVRMTAATLRLVLGRGLAPTLAAHGRVPNGRGGTPLAAGHRAGKGDVLATARLAAIAALKRTAEWIPLCHPVRVVGIDVDLDGDARLPGIRVRVAVRAFDRTGVEMEAMVGAAAAALTIYDMVKGVERGVEIVGVRLEEKRGGRSGTWRRAGGPAAAPLATSTRSGTSKATRGTREKKKGTRS